MILLKRKRGILTPSTPGGGRRRCELAELEKAARSIAERVHTGVSLSEIRELVSCVLELVRGGASHGIAPVAAERLANLFDYESSRFRLRVGSSGASEARIECIGGSNACQEDLKTIVVKLLGSDGASLALCLDSYVPPSGQRAALILIPFLAYSEGRAPDFFRSMAVSVDHRLNVGPCECVEKRGRECDGIVEVELIVRSLEKGR